MYRRSVSCVLALMAGCFACGLSASASAGLQIVDQSVRVGLRNARADFALTFNQPPLSELLTVDEFDRPQGSFQYEINPDWDGDPRHDPLDHVSVIIRGDEIRIANDLRIRDVAPAVPEPIAGGWGKIRGKVPFAVSGDTLSFSVPLKLIGDNDGVFGYRVFSTDFGQTETMLQSQVVPLGRTVWAGCLLLAAIALYSAQRRWGGVTA